MIEQSEEHKETVPYPDLEKEYEPDHCYEELLMYFEGRDSEVWQEQINEPNLKQSRCFIEDRPVIMMKATTILKCPSYALLEVATNFETRMKWD